LGHSSLEPFRIVINKTMKKLVIDSLASLTIIVFFLPLMVCCMFVAACEFAVTWPKQIIEIVNVHYGNDAGEDTQI